MSATRRLQLLEWAQRAAAWIVEDDYDSEYRYNSKPIASLQGMDQTRPRHLHRHFQQGHVPGFAARLYRYPA